MKIRQFTTVLILFVATLGGNSYAESKPSPNQPNAPDAPQKPPYSPSQASWMVLYDDVVASQGKYIVKKSGRFGVLDQSGKVVVPVRHNELYDLMRYEQVQENGTAYLAKLDDQYGIYDGKGRIILPFEYDKHGKFDKGALPLSKDGKWGVIQFVTDADGTPNFNQPYWVLVDFTLDYDYLRSFSNGLALVRKGGLFGYINQNGKEVISPSYDQALPFYPVSFAIEDNQNSKLSNQPVAFVGIQSDERMRYGVIDVTGKAVIPIEFDAIHSNIKDYVIVVSKDGKFGAFGRGGDVILPIQYDNIFMHHCLFIESKPDGGQSRQCQVLVTKDGVKDTVGIEY